MNKNIIMASVLFLLIGFGGGYLYFKNSSNLNNVVENQEIKTEIKEQAKVDQNKLFTLLDSFKIYPEYSNISKIREDLGMMIVSYSEIPEQGRNYEGDGLTQYYSIYDYKNDVMYDKVGDMSLGRSNLPIAIINKDTILMDKYDDNTGKESLSIKNIKDGTTKVLPIKLNNEDRVSAGLNPQDKIDIFIYSKTTFLYNLNPQTLELKLVWER